MLVALLTNNKKHSYDHHMVLTLSTCVAVLGALHEGCLPLSCTHIIGKCHQNCYAVTVLVAESIMVTVPGMVAALYGVM